jgi:hypothetical protein
MDLRQPAGSAIAGRAGSKRIDQAERTGRDRRSGGGCAALSMATTVTAAISSGETIAGRTSSGAFTAASGSFLADVCTLSFHDSLADARS